MAAGKLYRNTKNCIVTAKAVGYWTVSQHRAATRRAGRRHRAGEQARGARAAGRRGVRAAGRSGARAAGRRGKRAARRVRVAWPGLCTWCTQSVFGPV